MSMVLVLEPVQEMALVLGRAMVLGRTLETAQDLEQAPVATARAVAKAREQVQERTLRMDTAMAQHPACTRRTDKEKELLGRGQDLDRQNNMPEQLALLALLELPDPLVQVQEPDKASST